MNGIEKRAGYYRGYLTDDRSLIPLTIVLGFTVALWLLVYLIGSVGPPYKPQMGCCRRMLRRPSPSVLGVKERMLRRASRRLPRDAHAVAGADRRSR
jgi:hypothetical protein